MDWVAWAAVLMMVGQTFLSAMGGMGSGIPMPVLLHYRNDTGMRVRLPMPP
jgi:hypothetical protein